MKYLYSLLLALVPFLANAQTEVTEFNPGVTANGVNYALPKTAIKSDVYAMKVVYTPGEFSKFANRFLHVNGVSSEESTEWSVTKLNFYQEGEPDTLKYFTIKLKDKTTAPFVQLSSDGRLLAVNTNVEEKENVLPPVRKSAPHIDGKQYLTEEILMATSISKMAELTAEEILSIRESKNEIKRGQVESMPKDGASLKIVLDELNQQEEALTRLFTGYTDTTFVAQTFTIVPQADIDKGVFFRFSNKLGFVDADDLAGEPYYISVTDKHTVVIPTEKEAAKRKIQGLVYNMPGNAHVRVETIDNVLLDRDLPFAQFGTIDMLSPTLFNKGATTKLILNPATGGVKSLEQ